MPQQFITQLEQVCRGRQRRRWVAAVCWALVCVFVAALALVGLDRALGIADPLGRMVLSLTFFSICGWIARHWFRFASEHHVTPLQVAQEIESRHPDLRDVVTSAWDFSQQEGNDPTAGSESLRRAVVLRAATAVEDFDWAQFIPRQPLRQAALALAGVSVVVCMLSWLMPQVMGIGLTRLTNPMHDAQWPREHDLQFIEPVKLLAAGDDLLLRLQDSRTALPAAIEIHYRSKRQGRWHEETQSLATSTEPLEIRRSNVQEALQYRATGGDHHTMPWHSLEVVPPPRIDALSVTVHPPAYTKLPARPLDSNTPVYSGSRLQLRGKTDQPITKLMLECSQGKKLAAVVAPDGLTFSIEPAVWQATESDTYALQLTTSSGLTVRAATDLAIEVVADQPPQVQFVDPTDDLTVLPNIDLPLVIEATDELGIRDIELVYHRSDRSDAGEQRTSLWHSTTESTAENVTTKQLNYLWRLKELSLEPGSVHEVRAQATDFQPTTGQTVRALRIKVIAEDELWRQILEQQSRVVEILARLLREQRDLKDVTAEWAEFPTWATARWVNASHSALFRQRQISDVLAGGQRSVIDQLAGIRATIERNRLLRSEAADRLLAAESLLRSLADGPIANAEQSLTEVVRQVQRSLDQKVLAPIIKGTALHQGQVVNGIQQAIELLMPGNVLGRLERELVEIESDQSTLMEHCRVELAPQVLRSEGERSEDRGGLSTAVRRQRALASRLAEWMFDMKQTAERLTESEPSLALRLAETAALADALGTQATIQTAADQLTRRRLGLALSSQQQTLEDLAKLIALLKGQDAKATGERFKQLQDAERKLQRLRGQVAKLERELSELTAEQRQRELERLRRLREQLAEQTESLTRQLERLGVPAAAKAASKAASQLRQAKLDGATTKQAKQQLDAARQQVTNARRRQHVALARLQMAQLDTKLRAFVGRQQAILHEIERLDSLRQADGDFNRAQQASVLQLAEVQAELGREVVAQADELTTLPVFAFLLQAASKKMQNVEERLRIEELGQPTQSFVEAVVRQLTELADAVRQEQKKLAEQGSEAGGGSGGGQSGDTPQQQTLQLALGQMQLLKSLQSGLREKTQTLEIQEAAGEPLTYLRSELTQQQQQLTELTRQLTPEPADPPSENLFPNLEQELEQSFEEMMIPRRTSPRQTIPRRTLPNPELENQP